MPELLTLQDLAKGHLDVKALGEAANGDENTIVTTRTGNTYPSAERAINIMFQNGGLPAEPFETLAKMNTDGASLLDGQLAMVHNDADNTGLYVKKAGVWIKSDYPFYSIDRYMGDVFFSSGDVTNQLFANFIVSSVTGNLEKGGGSSSFKTFVLKLVKNTAYTIAPSNDSNRFRYAFLSREPNLTDTSVGSVEFKNLDASISPTSIYTGDNEWLAVYVGDALAPKADVKVSRETPVAAKDFLVKGITGVIGPQNIADKSIPASKTDFIKEVKDEVVGVRSQYWVYYDGVDEAGVYLQRTSDVWSYEFDISELQGVDVTISLPLVGRNRFRVVGFESSAPINTASPIDEVINLVDNKSTVTFYNEKLSKLLIQVNTVSTQPITTKPNVYRLSAETVNKLNSDSYGNNTVKAKHTDFIDTKEYKAALTQHNDVLVFWEEGTPASLYLGIDGRSFSFDVPPSGEVDISVSGVGHNRFRVVGLDTEKVTPTSRVAKEINLDSTKKSVKFTNDGTINKILVQVHTNNAGAVTETPDVTIKEFKLKFLAASASAQKESGYKLLFGKTPLSNGINSTLNYPRLATVRYEYAENTLPKPVGYLFTYNDAFYYAANDPCAEKVKIADWNRAITKGGNQPIYKYHQILTADGDIICVYRGDLEGGEFNPEARQNPIVYPAGDYANPVVVDLGAGVKPTAWLLSSGASIVPNQDTLLFCEYTRPAHEKAYIWKVTKPYTDPANWQVKKEFVLSRPNTEGEAVEGNLKHMHTMSYDPWSGAVFSSTGDYFWGAKILMSKDFGETWAVVAENDEKRCRVLNISFDETGAYWASDSHGAKHVFIYAARGLDGYPDLSLDNMVIKYVLNDGGAQATYGTVRLQNPNGFLLLDRHDSITTAPLVLKFWSLEDEEMYEVASINKRNDISGTAGFRSDCITYYQSPDYPHIPIGFNDSSYYSNANDVAGNSPGNKTNNLLLTLVNR